MKPRTREFKPGKRRSPSQRPDRKFGGGGPSGRFMRKKVCRFCADRTEIIDFKDRDRVARFLTEKGKIIPRRTTGNCAGHQRMLARAIKRARHAAIVAFQID
ncbi:MAG TPA: 30S ribosomal protein S18 [bacterium]|nr:30S ribosomal protein S18 [bacterium]